MKEDYTTYLVRNIPRSMWNKVKVKGIESNKRLNDLMLKLIDRFSKGEITLDWDRKNIFWLHGFKTRRKLSEKIQRQGGLLSW